MKLNVLGRCLTPLGWAVLAGLLMVLMVVVVGGVISDPLGLKAHRLERAQQAAERGRAEALARELETLGRTEQAQRLDEAQQRLRQVAEATAHTRTEARRAADADTPLDQSRLDRLRNHDRQLCDQARPLAGCPATAGRSA